MTSLFRRALAGTAATGALVAGLSVAPSAAQAAGSSWTPGPADFADCPKTLPAGAVPYTWLCYSITAVSGNLSVGSLKVAVNQPIRITIAQGNLTDGSFAATWGGITSDPIPAPSPLPGILNITTQIQPAGQVGAGFPIPKLGTKIKVNAFALGDNCYIGSDGNPLVLNPAVSNLNLTLIDNVPVIQATATDNTYTVPAAKGCGLGLLDWAINLYAGLPSPSGKNSAVLNADIRISGYAPTPSAQARANGQSKAPVYRLKPLTKLTAAQFAACKGGKLTACLKALSKAAQ